MRISSSQPNIPLLTTSNRFALLPVETLPPDVETCSLPDRLDESINNPITIPRRRPQVVVNNHPESEREFNRPPPIMPGPRSYSRAHVTDTLILSDSMSNRINRRQLIANLNSSEENVRIKKFPGANCADIHHYAIRHLNIVRPKRFIAVCGTNDLPNYGGITTEWEIAMDIIKIGRLARSFGVEDIHLSSIINRRGAYFAKKLAKVNTILEMTARRFSIFKSF